MQHDLFVNPNARHRGIYPLLADLQGDLVGGTNRVIAPLARRQAVAGNESRYLPLIANEGTEYRVMLTLLASLPAHMLRHAVGTIHEARFEITRGLDWLFSGL